MTYWERRNIASELKKVHSIFRFILIMSRVKEICNTVFVIVFCWLVFHSYMALKIRIAAGTKVIPFTGILNKNFTSRCCCYSTFLNVVSPGFMKVLLSK